MPTYVMVFGFLDTGHSTMHLQSGLGVIALDTRLE